MIATVDNAVLRDYLDALLQDGTPAADLHDDPVPNWQLCRLGRLQLLLPSGSVGAPIAAAGLTAPDTWHGAHVRIGMVDWQVVELGACIAPGLAAAPIDTLLPVIGSRWLLGVPGLPEPLILSDDAIEWRTQRSSRPWLSGMSRDGQYMALDVQALIEHAASTHSQEPHT